MDQLKDQEKKVLVEVEDLYKIYKVGDETVRALDGVSFQIFEGEFIAIVGTSGSGKSTLIQHMIGLIKATDGHIYYEGEDICDEKYNLRKLRSDVGLVFQYPEHQLFEVDVLTDVCFGPKNQGLSDGECKTRAMEALQLVGLPEKYYEVSPFELSGGQKRRAAIAGVLAMKPKVLILDEPTAGLDPQGRDEILDRIAYLQKQENLTVVLVSHSMEDIAKYVERIIVMNKGAKILDDKPKAVFAQYKELERVGLAAPSVTYMMHALAEKGIPVDTQATTVKEAVQTITQALEP